MNSFNAELKKRQTAAENKKEEETAAVTAKPPPALATSDRVYFYQSSDGQRIYINGLNSRCLAAEYGASLAQAPLSLSGRIVASDSLFMTDENRRRFRHLAHLPLHTEFKLVELELAEPVLSRATLGQFGAEIEERRVAREKKLIREKRNADKAAARHVAHYDATPHYYQPSAMSEFVRSSGADLIVDMSEFPEASSSPPATGSSSASTISLGSSSNSSSGSGGGLVDPNLGSTQVSFASMLNRQTSSASNATRGSSLAKADSHAWPSLDSTVVASSSAAANHQMTSGWLTMVKQQQQQGPVLGRTKKYQNAPAPWSSGGLVVASTSVAAAADSLTSPEEEEDEMPAPLYKQSFFSAIDESFRLIESSECNFFPAFLTFIF